MVDPGRTWHKAPLRTTKSLGLAFAEKQIGTDHRRYRIAVVPDLGLAGYCRMVCLQGFHFSAEMVTNSRELRRALRDAGPR